MSNFACARYFSVGVLSSHSLPITYNLCNTVINVGPENLHYLPRKDLSFKTAHVRLSKIDRIDTEAYNKVSRIHLPDQPTFLTARSFLNDEETIEPVPAVAKTKDDESYYYESDNENDNEEDSDVKACKAGDFSTTLYFSS